MLLLNHSVCDGSTIMFEAGGVPEDHFPLPMAAADEAQQGPEDVAVRGQSLQRCLHSASPY